MAISYDLDMATNFSATQVAHELRDIAQTIGLLDASVASEQLLEDGVATGSGMWIRVIEAKPHPWDVVNTYLGFTPTVWVVFRLNKMGEIPDQQDDMIRVVSGVLDRIPGDAVLHFEGESIWLLRHGGDLSLNERDDLWPPHRLALVSQPYRRSTHHFS